MAITTAEEAVAAVARLEKQVVEQSRYAKWLDAYYRGQHPLGFASEQFREAWGKLFNRFSDNWCGVVVDSVAERLEVVGFRQEGSRDGDADAWRIWQRSAADVDSNLAFIDALVAGRSYALVWMNEDDESVPFISFESPTQVAVEYEAGSRRRRASALKMWSDGDFEYANLYTPTEVWKFKRAEAHGYGGPWVIREVAGEPWPARHPLGSVPIVELRNRPRLAGDVSSEIETVAPMQDTVNLLWSHLLTASDFAAFPQRVILGTEIPMVPVLDGSGAVVGERAADLDRFRVDRLLWLENPETKIDQFAAADLQNYVRVIEVAVQHIAAQTRTPPHYLLGQMVNLSGEALAAAEAGLVSKVTERQAYFADGLREVMRLAHLAAGDAQNADAIAGGRVLWRDAQYRTESEHTDALVKMRALGVPDEALWERIAGVDQTEIARWRSMRDEAVSAAGADLLAALAPKPSVPPVV